MRNVRKGFKNFFFDGLMFLLPLAFIIFLFSFLVGIIIDIITPITEILPKVTILGQSMPKLSALVILFLIILLCAAIGRSRTGSIISERLEGLVAKVIPGFSIIKNLFYEQKEIYNDKKIKPALALIDDAWLFAFILEEKNDADLLTVYVPSSPIPTSGNVYLMTEQQIKRLDITVKEAVTCITQLGIGSGKILAGKIPK